MVFFSKGVGLFLNRLFFDIGAYIASVVSSFNFLATTTGVILIPVFEYLYGSDEIVRSIMSALVIFIVLDWISGVRASKKDYTYASKYGIDGVFRSFFILLLPSGGHLLDQIIGFPSIVFGALSLGILYHVLQSMTANSIRAGWGSHVPEWLLSKLVSWVKIELETKIKRSEKRKEEMDK